MGEGLGFHLGFCPGGPFFCQLSFQGSEGLGSQVLVSRLDAKFHELFHEGSSMGRQKLIENIIQA
jgi:hypothetical protein